MRRRRLGPSGQPATAPSTSVAETSPGGTAPAELQGTWRLVSENIFPGPVRLYIRATTYSVSEAGAGHNGQLAVQANVIEVTSMDCRDTSARYRWRIEGDKLHLAAIGKDPCGGRRTGFEGHYLRALRLSSVSPLWLCA